MILKLALILVFLFTFALPAQDFGLDGKYIQHNNAVITGRIQTAFGSAVLNVKVIGVEWIHGGAINGQVKNLTFYAVNTGEIGRLAKSRKPLIILLRKDQNKNWWLANTKGQKGCMCLASKENIVQLKKLLSEIDSKNDEQLNQSDGFRYIDENYLIEYIFLGFESPLSYVEKVNLIKLHGNLAGLP